VLLENELAVEAARMLYACSQHTSGERRIIVFFWPFFSPYKCMYDFFLPPFLVVLGLNLPVFIGLQHTVQSDEAE
jgi:hypothetical protein